MDFSSSKCRHPDVRKFDSVRCCLACGLAIFDEPTVHDVISQDDGLTFYSYKRLNHDLGQQIRLVVILPRSSGDDVHVRIEHVNLIDKPTYEAVSYTWQTEDGDGSLSERIYHEGKTIAVTKNCLAALLHLSSGAWEERVLWIDAVCIDQNNIQERNHQVRMMNVIYSNAYQVLIYLGEESQSSGFPPPSPDKDHPLDSLSDNRSTDEHYMRQFLRRRWFDRVWVLQEIALAKSALLIVGGEFHEELDITNFKTTMMRGKAIPWTFGLTSLLLQLYTAIEKERSPPSVFHWAPGSIPNHPDLLDVLDRSRNCSATDPRDKVFAVLNLVDAEYQDYIPVDYSKSVEDVYVGVAKDLIMRKRLIGVLSHACAKSEDVSSMAIPSWVPGWNRKNVTMLPRQFSVPQVKVLSSSWSFEATLEVPSETLNNDIWDNDLPASELDGPVVSTATWRHRLLLRSRDGNGKKLSPQEVSRHALEITQSHNKDFHFTISKRELCVNDLGITYPELFLHNSLELSSVLECLRIRGHLLGIVCQTGVYPYKSTALLGAYEDLASFLGPVRQAFDNCECTRNGTAALSNQFTFRTHSHFNSQWEEYMTFFKRYVGKGTMFQTQSSIGIALLTLQKDDSVWALDGAHLPYILRNVDGHYILVGECYYCCAMKIVICLLCGARTSPVPIIRTEIIDIW